MAIKGCTRQMIVLNGNAGGMFETAYFIVKPDAGQRPLTQSDMLREANRIVEENSFAGTCRRRAGTRTLLFFAGVAAGAFCMGILWLAVSLILR